MVKLIFLLICIFIKLKANNINKDTTLIIENQNALFLEFRPTRKNFLRSSPQFKNK